MRLAAGTQHAAADGWSACPKPTGTSTGTTTCTGTGTSTTTCTGTPTPFGTWQKKTLRAAASSATNPQRACEV